MLALDERTIGPIDREVGQPWQGAAEKGEPFGIGEGRDIDDHPQEKTLRVGEQMAFAIRLSSHFIGRPGPPGSRTKNEATMCHCSSVRPSTSFRPENRNKDFLA